MSTEIWDATPGQDPVGSYITSMATGKHAILGHGYFRGPEAGAMNQVQVRSEAPAITGVPAFNDPGDDGVFDTGDTVEVTFTFSQAVRVDTEGGTPSVPVLLSGAAAKQAPYLRGSGTGRLVFGYTLTATDGEHSSLLVAPNSLVLNGGAIQDAANDLDANIGHQGGAAAFVRRVAANSPATGAPTISGTAQVGETLTASTTGISDADGMTNATFTYQWLADDTDISGATSSTYSLTTGEQGKAIKVTVTFTDDAGNSESLTSTATAAVAASPGNDDIGTNDVEPPANTPATGAPTISGTAQVGQTLTASTTGISDADGLTNATFTYQWLADDTDISGATSSTYALTTGEQGKAIKVTVTFTDDAGNAESRTSQPTGPVAAAPQPGLSLSDLDVGDGQRVLAAALIEVGDRGRKDDDSRDRAWYATDTPAWNASGELRDGSLSWNEMTLTRVAYFTGTGILRFNEADDDFHLGNSFAEGGVNRNLTIWVKTETGTVPFLARDHIVNSGSGYINFSVPQAGRATLDAVAKDDLIIVAVSAPDTS